MKGIVKAGRHTIVPDDIDCYITLRLGSFVSIASGLKIVSGQHPPVDNPNAVSTFPFAEHGWGIYPPSRHDGVVVVGNDVWIGQDVSIMDGVIVGHGAIVAAGSVVVKNVPAYAVVAGNPAETKKYRFQPATRELLLRTAWWDWSDEAIKAALPRMADYRKLLDDPTPRVD